MSDGPTLHGQQYDPAKSVVLRFTETERDYTGNTGARVTGYEGNTATDISPTDRQAAKVRVYDLAAIQAALDAEVIKYFDYVDLTGKLPLTLSGVTVTYNKNFGNGETNQLGSDMSAAFVGGGSITLAPRSEAQASASILPDIHPVITETYGVNREATVCLFYMADPMTKAQLLTRLTTIMGATVNAFPLFKPRSDTIIVKGQSADASQQANAQVSVAVQSDGGYQFSRQKGSGYSKSVGTSSKAVQLPPTIHGAVTYTGSTSDTRTATIDVEASTVAIDTDVTAADQTALTSDPGQITITVTGEVTPTSLTATSVTAIPTTGLYLVDVQTQVSEWERLLVRAVVADFTQFA